MQKPDLILCHRPVSERKIDIRVDVLSTGEMKASNQTDNLKELFIKLAGKAAFLHQAQDGRYTAPCIRILGEDIVFTLFNHGGSISTQPINIHSSPEIFLCILLRITFASRITLGFDPTVHEVKNKTRDIKVTLVDGGKGVINVNELLFISGSLHGCGTTIWSSHFTRSGVDDEVVVKDSFMDPLCRYTEGRILAMLNQAGVVGVPELILKQLVQTEHPLTKVLVTNLTHIARTLLSSHFDKPLYHLHVLSRLVTKPCGHPIFEFSSLAELLIGFMDCITSEPPAVEFPYVSLTKSSKRIVMWSNLPKFCIATSVSSICCLSQ